jgi:hypothetical protein
VKACFDGVRLGNSTGTVTASIDHCHLDANGHDGFLTNTIAPGGSTTTATNTTANGNTANGWGSVGSGIEILNLEFCVASQNGVNGVGGAAGSTNASSVVRYSSCVLANNSGYGVSRADVGAFESRGNNTITGNGSGPTSGTIGAFSPI